MARPCLGVADEVLRRNERLLPASLPVAVEDMLALLPADEANCTDALGQATAPLVQFSGAAEVSGHRRGNPGQVRRCRGLLV